MATIIKPGGETPHHEYEEICLLYGLDNTIFARFSDILLVRCKNKMLTLWVDDEGSLLSCNRMLSLAKFLTDSPPGLFFRYHRSWLINLDRIYKREREKLFFTHHLELTDGPYIPHAQFRKILKAVNLYRRSKHGDG